MPACESRVEGWKEACFGIVSELVGVCAPARTCARECVFAGRQRRQHNVPREKEKKVGLSGVRPLSW